ncbi:MAG: YerC/YecD family TrpR-related protein [Patescibacteria group bacterium]
MNWNSKEARTLLEAILSLKSENEARRFLRDLMTEKEIAEFGKRLQAAQMLTQNISYAVIEKQTGLSSTTVARVSKWLNGKEGGYKTVISRLHHGYSTYMPEA